MYNPSNYRVNPVRVLGDPTVQLTSEAEVRASRFDKSNNQEGL